MKKIIACLAFALTLGAPLAHASSLNVDMNCPATVKAGQQLSLSIYLSNWSTASTISVSRAMILMAGTSSSNDLGSAEVWGPLHKNGFGTKTVPKAANYNTPGTLAAFTISTPPVSTSFAGKMAVVGVNFIDSAGRDLSGDMCVVAVTN